jgi:hypothetical protein
VVTRDGGGAHVAAREAMVGLAAACPAQLVTAPSPPAALAVMLGRPAVVTEVPMTLKEGVAVVTLLCQEESRDTAMHHQQGRRAPSPEASVPLGPALAAVKKRASKRTPDKPLAVEPGPTAMAGRRAGAGLPAGAAMELTPQKWCPLRGTSLHDVMAYHHIEHLVGIHRERLAKHAAVGVIHGYYECGQAGHWLHDCPGKVPLSEGPSGR